MYLQTVFIFLQVGIVYWINISYVKIEIKISFLQILPIYKKEKIK